MNWLDLAIVAVIAWSAFSAFRAGLIRVVVSLISTVVGAVLAGRLYAQLAGNIDFLAESPEMRNLVAFVAIFAGVMVLGQVLSAMVRTASSLLFLGPLDHVGGAIFGFVQGLLVVELLLFAVTTYPATPALARALEGSTLAPVFITQIPIFERLVPQEFRTAIGGFGAGALPIPGGLLPGGVPSGVIPGPGAR